MNNFEFLNPTRIIFGKGVEEQTGAHVKAMGNKALLHYGSGSIKQTGLYDKIVKSLHEAGVPFVELGGVVPNPRLSLVKEGINLCLKEGVDCILSVGGGSVIDSAKAIAMGAAMGATDIWPIFIGKGIPTAALPTGSVLTIPAAGSESSFFTVITNDENWYKRSVPNPILFPRFAIINPELSFSLPPYQIGCGCVDILAHLMERYFTNVEHVDVSDRMLEGIMLAVLDNAAKTCENPADYNSRAEITWAGTLAHNSLLDRGRIGDWASHGVAAELSALYDLAHGASLSIAFPAWMKYVYKHNTARFVQFAVRVMGVEPAHSSGEAVILEGINRLEKFYTSIGMPTRLSHANIPAERLREMAERTVEFGSRGNILSITADDAENIYKLMV